MTVPNTLRYLPLSDEGPTTDAATLIPVQTAPNGIPGQWQLATLPQLSFAAGIINVMDPRFAGGAKGNGSHNDTDAFLAAVEAGTALGGGLILVPPGTFMIEALVDIGLNWLYGVGKGTVIRCADASAGLVLSESRSQMCRFMLDTNTAVTGSGIDVRGYPSFWRIADVLVFGSSGIAFGDSGIKVTEGLSGIMDNARVDNSGNHCIYLTGTLGGNVPNAIRLIAPGVRNSAVSDILVENASQGPTILHPVSEGPSPIGIHILHSPHTQIINPYFEATGSGVGTRVQLKLENSDACMCSAGEWGGGGSIDVDLINSSVCTIEGLYPNSTTQISFDATSNNNIVLGGQLTTSAIVDLGSNNRLFMQGGFDDGKLASPGIGFRAEIGTGFYRSATGEVSLALQGAQAYRFNSGGYFLVKNGATKMSVQDTNSTSRSARFQASTVNGTYNWGPTIGSGSTFDITDPSSNIVLELATPASNDTGLLIRVNRAGTTTLSTVRIGASGTGPGGTGRALYVDA